MCSKVKTKIRNSETLRNFQGVLQLNKGELGEIITVFKSGNLHQ